MASFGTMIAAGYGILAALVFQIFPDVRRNSYAQIAYLTGFVGVVVFMADSLGRSYGPAALPELLLGGVIVLLCNAVPMKYALDSLLTGLQHAFSSNDNLNVRRTYDRAEGAESRGEHQLAEQIYREYLAEDPSDPVGHRKLAELLLKMNKREEAVREFQAGLEVCKDPEEEQRTLWRLGELLQQAGGTEEALSCFRRLVRRHPDSRTARYARTRIERLDPENTETP